MVLPVVELSSTPTSFRTHHDQLLLSTLYTPILALRAGQLAFRISYHDSHFRITRKIVPTNSIIDYFGQSIMGHSKRVSFIYPTPAFGAERLFSSDPNPERGYPSFNARMSIYYPVEPPSIREAQARVNAIKASAEYKRLELDQHLIEEFRKVNLENRTFLEELLRLEKAKLCHPFADTVDLCTDEVAEKEGPTPNSPQESVCEQDIFLAALEEDSSQEDRKQFKPVFERPGTPWPSKEKGKGKGKGKGRGKGKGNGRGKGKANFGVQNTPTPPINDYPIFQSPESCPKGFDSQLGNEISFSDDDSTLNSTHPHSDTNSSTVIPDEPGATDPSLSNKSSDSSIAESCHSISGLPHILTPAHPAQEAAQAPFRPTPSIHLTTNPILTTTPIIMAPSPLRPRFPSHARRLKRREEWRQTRYWPIDPSPSGLFHPQPFPPLHAPRPYVAWPGIPGQSEHRGEVAELDASAEQQVGRRRADAVLADERRPVFELSEQLPQQQQQQQELEPQPEPPHRKWSFIRGKKDVAHVRPRTRRGSFCSRA